MQSLSTQDTIWLILWALVLAAVVHWGHTFRRKQRDIIGNRRFYYILSGTVMGISLLGLIFKGLNYGLDFTGGTMIELGSYRKLTVPEVREALKDFPVPLADVIVTVGTDMIQPAQTAPAPAPRPPASPAAASPPATPAAGTAPSPPASPAAASPPAPPTEASPAVSPAAAAPAALESVPTQPYQKVLVRVTREGGLSLSTEESRALITHLNARLGTMVELQTVSIGPTITGELKSKAVWAVVIALVLQLLYITFRFGNLVRFGLAADVALVHDLVIMVGIYALSGRGVDSPFVAAVLTVMGYSVMDSVVIFDRIRENMKRLKGTFSEICNVSVNETMTRSVNTTLTVVLVCLALFFFGGSTLKNFAFALLVGIISGAYSSIFVASPILVEFDAIAKKREAERAQKRRLEAEARARQRKGPVEVAPSQDYPSAQELPDVNGKVAGRRPGERRRRKGTRRRGS